MSTDRPNSGVQNLRAMFENQEANAQRSSSPSGRSSVGEGERKVSKVRASFVSVDRPGDLVDTTGAGDMSAESNGDNAVEKKDASTTSSALNVSDHVQAHTTPSEEPENTESKTPQITSVDTNSTKASVEAEQTKPKESTSALNNTASIQEATSSSAAATESASKTSVLPTKDVPAENSDKPTTSGEEEPGPLKPAEPTNTATSAAVTSTPKSVTKKPSRANVAAKDSTPASPAVRQNKADTPSKTLTPKTKPSLNFRQSKGPASPAVSKAEVPKSPARPTTSDSKASEKSASSHKATSRGGRSSLTAQTASSAAKSKPGSSDPSKNASNDKSLPTRSKPRSPTRPMKLPSHLTAPTAASAARQDSNKAAAKSGPIAKVSGTSSVRSSLGDLKSSTHNAKNGLGRSNSTATRPNQRPAGSKPVVADEGFLARMMRPTASSASRAHEKPDSKPAQSKPPTTIKPRSATDSKPKASAKTEQSKQDPSSGSEAKTTSVPNGHVEKPTTATPVKENQQPTQKESTPALKQDDTNIDASIAGIGTPGVDAPTIR
ncbi:Hypothetical protein D9617_8g051760 [Elsinoe fawcettii]|nr:Hypothetical protein D9617_8g051760 [Elsinoe fawcettii]